MTYFIELYDDKNSHIGTRALRASTQGEAADEVCALLRNLNNLFTSAHLFEQPPLANYRKVATYTLFTGHPAT